MVIALRDIYLLPGEVIQKQLINRLASNLLNNRIQYTYYNRRHHTNLWKKRQLFPQDDRGKQRWDVSIHDYPDARPFCATALHIVLQSALRYADNKRLQSRVSQREIIHCLLLESNRCSVHLQYIFSRSCYSTKIQCCSLFYPTMLTFAVYKDFPTNTCSPETASHIANSSTFPLSTQLFFLDWDNNPVDSIG